MLHVGPRRHVDEHFLSFLLHLYVERIKWERIHEQLVVMKSPSHCGQRSIRTDSGIDDMFSLTAGKRNRKTPTEEFVTSMKLLTFIIVLTHVFRNIIGFYYHLNYWLRLTLLYC